MVDQLYSNTSLGEILHPMAYSTEAQRVQTIMGKKWKFRFSFPLFFFIASKCLLNQITLATLSSLVFPIRKRLHAFHFFPFFISTFFLHFHFFCPPSQRSWGRGVLELPCVCPSVRTTWITAKVLARMLRYHIWGFPPMAFRGCM